MPAPAFDQLAAQPYVSLMTFRRNGTGVPTPIWVAPVDGKLYAVTNGTSAKMKRLKASERVQLAVCDSRGKVNGSWIEARARRVDDTSVTTRAAKALARKYTWQFTILNVVSRLFGRLRSRAFIEISL